MDRTVFEPVMKLWSLNKKHGIDTTMQLQFFILVEIFVLDTYSYSTLTLEFE